MTEPTATAPLGLVDALRNRLSWLVNPEPSNGPIDAVREPRQWATGFKTGVALVGAVILVLAAWNSPARLQLIAVGALLGLAAFVTGGLGGFLFAFSRYGTPPTASGYTPNTNLEQVSDWLTKILVGIGLVQAGTIARAFSALLTRASLEIDGSTGHRVLLGGILVFAVVPGFVTGYVQARVALPRWFKTADGGRG